MALYKEYEITLDTKRTPRIALQNIVAGETGDRLTVHLTNDDIPVALAAATHRVCLRINSSLGVRRQDSAVDGSGVSFSDGAAVILLSADAFAAGLNHAVLEVYTTETEDDDTLICSAEFQFTAAGNPTGENAGETYPLMAYWEKQAESWAHGGTGKRDGEDIDNAEFYSDLARETFVEGEVNPSITAWMDANAEDVENAIGDWLDAHPEATTTVEDGAITNAKLANDLKSIIGIESTSGEMFDADDWVTGYVGSTRIYSTSSNGDIRTDRGAPVHAGDVITVTIKLPKTETYAYLYYAYVTSETNLTYVSSRYGSSAKYNRSDSDYRYYDLTINVVDDGFIIFSYRPKGLAVTASSFLGSTVTNNIAKLDARLTQAESDIDDAETAITALQTANTADMYYRFPSSDMLPIDVCHRGLCAEGLPENTLAAYAACKTADWKWVETDIRMTSDGVWVCLHDGSINRTARNADGTSIESTINIADITYDEALEYDFGIYAGAQYAGTKILSLDDFLNFCNKARLYAQLEVKNSTWTAAQMQTAWDIVVKYGMQNKVMWLCSSYGGFDDILDLYPYAAVVFTGSSSWTVIDPDDFATTPPSGLQAMTGKNKVFWERLQSSFADLAAQENFIAYCKYWGIFPGVYCPTTQSAMDGLSARLDIVCSQYIKYTTAKMTTLIEDQEL